MNSGVLRIVMLSACLASTTAFASTLGPLEKVLSIGQDNGWIGTMGPDGYWLENPTEQGAIRYYYASHEEGSGGKRKLTIDVDVSNTTKQARAGLLYGLQNNPLRYFMIMLGRGGQVEVYKRDENGVNLMISSTVPLNQGHNRIEIREDGASVSYFVNGTSMGSIENQNTGKGALGIAAMGIGRFGFANFEQGETGGWFN